MRVELCEENEVSIRWEGVEPLYLNVTLARYGKQDPDIDGLKAAHFFLTMPVDTAKVIFDGLKKVVGNAK
jgi:hypothetical protein